MLQYSQAEILGAAIIANDWASQGGSYPLQPWPLYISNEPPSPDEVVTIFSTQGIVDARLMVGGQVVDHKGIQIRVRSPDFQSGRSYLEGLRVNLSENLYYYTVSVGPGTSANQYEIQACVKFGNILELGKEAQHSRRNIFVLNFLMMYQDVTLPN